METDHMDDDPTNQIIDEMIADEAPRFTQGQMDAFAVENVDTERKRLHGILSRVLGKEYFPEHELEIIQDPRPMIQEILDKVILGNRK